LVLKINFIVTKPATTVEQCRVKSRKVIYFAFKLDCKDLKMCNLAIFGTFQ